MVRRRAAGRGRVGIALRRCRRPEIRHRLLNLLTSLSLLLCVAAVVLWVRTYLVTDWVGCLAKADHGRGGIAWTWLAGRG